jgi:hypothetical protein
MFAVIACKPMELRNKKWKKKDEESASKQTGIIP